MKTLDILEIRGDAAICSVADRPGTFPLPLDFARELIGADDITGLSLDLQPMRIRGYRQVFVGSTVIYAGIPTVVTRVHSPLSVNNLGGIVDLVSAEGQPFFLRDGVSYGEWQWPGNPEGIIAFPPRLGRRENSAESGSVCANSVG